MPQYKVSSPAYLKIILHAAKHPHLTVNGVLVGKDSASGQVDILDAIPLLHHWTSLSPMMEIGLDLARTHAESQGLKLVGYYQASDRLDDTALAPVGEKIASKIKSSFENAIAFVIDGPKLGAPGEAALIPFSATSTSSSWRAVGESAKTFGPNSSFQLVSSDIVDRAISLIRSDSLQEKFGDFDDHLEDVSIDWLRNGAALPSDLK